MAQNKELEPLTSEDRHIARLRANDASPYHENVILRLLAQVERGERELALLRPVVTAAIAVRETDDQGEGTSWVAQRGLVAHRRPLLQGLRDAVDAYIAQTGAYHGD